MTRPQPLRGGVVVPDDLWEHREAHAGSEHRLEAEHIVGGTERGGDQFALEEAEAAVPESSLPPELTVVGGEDADFGPDAIGIELAPTSVCDLDAKVPGMG